MLTININGEPYTAYEHWHEVPLAKLVQADPEQEPYLALTGIDVPAIIDALPDTIADRLEAAYIELQLVRAEPVAPLAYIGRQPLAKYIEARLALQHGNYYQATRVYYPDVLDSVGSAGQAWVQVATAITAYQEQWAWVDQLRFNGPQPNMDAMAGFGAMAMVYELAPNVLDVDKVLNLEADEVMTHRAYHTHKAVLMHNWQLDQAKIKPK